MILVWLDCSGLMRKLMFMDVYCGFELSWLNFEIFFLLFRVWWFWLSLLKEAICSNDSNDSLFESDGSLLLRFILLKMRVELIAIQSWYSWLINWIMLVIFLSSLPPDYAIFSILTILIYNCSKSVTKFISFKSLPKSLIPSTFCD